MCCLTMSFSLLQYLDRDKVKEVAGSLEGEAGFEEFASLTGTGVIGTRNWELEGGTKSGMVAHTHDLSTGVVEEN